MVFSQIKHLINMTQWSLIKCNMVLCIYLLPIHPLIYLTSYLPTYYPPTHPPTYYLPCYYICSPLYNLFIYPHTYILPTYLSTHLPT
jgi:hypothetical protein